MAAKPLPDADFLRKLLRYDPETGRLYWLPRGPEWFSTTGRGGSRGQSARWNGRFAGKEAGSIMGDGYVSLRLPKLGGGSTKCVLAHRLIWIMQTGNAPLAEIDHKNHIRADNRFSNLREATSLENCRNQKLMSHNTSGICGVYWDRRLEKWGAQIIVSKRRIFLGFFSSKARAARARKDADRLYGFAEEHGLPKSA